MNAPILKSSGSYLCSLCGKKFSNAFPGDAQKHLTSHIGVYARLLPITDSKEYEIVHS